MKRGCKTENVNLVSPTKEVESEPVIFRNQTDEDWDSMETAVPEILADSEYSQDSDKNG
jgi:hypothetical protein